MDRPLYPVPASEAGITPDWLAAALGSPVAGRPATERIGADYGFASDLFRVAWQEAGAPQAVVVKLWAAADRAAAREVAFYGELAPALPIRLPACHYAAWDGARAVLVLEDLVPTGQGDVLHPLDRAAAQRLAGVVAGLHSATAGWPAAGTFGAPRVPASRPEEWYASRRAAFLERFGPPPDPLLERLLSRLPEAHRLAAEVLAAAPDVLLHGDLHLDNVVFVGPDPVVLDWAGCGPGPAALDAVDVAFGAGPPAGFPEVLGGYRAALGEREAAVLGDVPFDDQIGAALLAKLATWTLGVARFHPPTRTEMVEAGIARAYRAVRAWHAYSPALLDAVP